MLRSACEFFLAANAMNKNRNALFAFAAGSPPGKPPL